MFVNNGFGDFGRIGRKMRRAFKSPMSATKKMSASLLRKTVIQPNKKMSKFNPFGMGMKKKSLNKVPSMGIRSKFGFRR